MCEKRKAPLEPAQKRKTSPEPAQYLNSGVEVSQNPTVNSQAQDTRQHGLAVIVGGLGYNQLRYPGAYLFGSETRK